MHGETVKFGISLYI